MIAVTGATGEVGRRVAARLDNPLLVVRDPTRAPAGARVASSYGALDEMTEARTLAGGKDDGFHFGLSVHFRAPTAFQMRP